MTSENGLQSSDSNDLSIVKVDEDGTCHDTASNPHSNNVPLNVEQSNDEIIVLSEEHDRIFSNTNPCITLWYLDMSLPPFCCLNTM